MGVVRDVLERVPFGKLKAVIQLLIGSAVGREVIACAGIVLHRSEKDDLADQRLDSALHALRDPRDPSEDIVMYDGGAHGFALEVSGIRHTNMICNGRGMACHGTAMALFWCAMTWHGFVMVLPLVCVHYCSRWHLIHCPLFTVSVLSEFLFLG